MLQFHFQLILEYLQNAKQLKEGEVPLLEHLTGKFDSEYLFFYIDPSLDST